MIGTVTAFASLLLLSPARIEINVDVKNGDTISGDRTFRATVASDKPVNQVEFYVGDDLRDTDSSTPYEFKIDTLAEKEGDVRLTFAAYTTEGENAKKAMTVRVDNALSKGAPFHVQQATDYLTVSKWDEAIQASRVALKAQAGYNPARITMARAYFGKGILDTAQKYAEDAWEADSVSVDAADLLAAINLQRAFNTVNRGGEPSETLSTIRGALKSAVEARRKTLDGALDRLGSPNDANRLAYADAAIKAGRFSAAIAALNPAFRADSANIGVANRLAFALMRTGRYEEALNALQEHQRRGGMDAYGYGMLAVILSERGKESESSSAMREAILSDSEDLGVRTAQAYIALSQSRFDTLGRIATDLAREQSMRTEVQYYLATLYNAMGQYEPARRAFERCVLAEPTNATMYVQRGSEALGIVAGGRVDEKQNKFQVQVANTFYETALAAKPDSAEALTGLCLVNVLSKATAEGLKYARAAAAANASYATGHYARSMAAAILESELRARAEAIRRSSRDGNLSAEQRTEIGKLLGDANALGKEAVEANKAAGKLDRTHLEGRNIPKTLDAYQYFARHGRAPFMTAPK